MRDARPSLVVADRCLPDAADARCGEHLRRADGRVAAAHVLNDDDIAAPRGLQFESDVGILVVRCALQQHRKPTVCLGLSGHPSVVRFSLAKLVDSATWSD